MKSKYLVFVETSWWTTTQYTSKWVLFVVQREIDMTMSSFLSLCNAVLKISNFRLGLHILTSCTIIFARDITKSSRNTHYSTNTRFISNYPDLNFNTFFPLNKKVNPFKKNSLIKNEEIEIHSVNLFHIEWLKHPLLRKIINVDGWGT